MIAVGKQINALLSPLGAVYPMLAPVDAKAPFIVYTRDNIARTYDKDGISEEVATVTVNVVHRSYSEAVAVAEKADGILTGTRRARLVEAGEAYYPDDNLFIQSLTYEMI